jgi:glycosyltransferase involved in cell wall biosynthesis
MQAAHPDDLPSRGRRNTQLLSVVVVVQDRASDVRALAMQLTERLSALASPYELVFVDNGSRDETLAELRRMTRDGALPDLQVYALHRTVDKDVAAWAGVENALGDYVAVVEPEEGAIGTIAPMLAAAEGGADIVFAVDVAAKARGRSLHARLERGFRALFSRFSGIDVQREAPYVRMVSRRVVNFILQYPLPAQRYRFVAATGGFTRSYLDYASVGEARHRSIGESVERGVRLLTTTTRAPLRLVNMLCAFGAAANMLYTVYVVAIALLKRDVAPGWVTLSLQQSGMFFLISLVLLVLGEYVLHVASLSSEGPPYHITQEFTSTARMRERALNVEER